MLARQIEAEEALVLGDPEPRMKLWSRRDPVTLFGAIGMSESGWEKLSQTFSWVASRFSDVSDFRFDVEVVDVSGDMAYTLGFERFNGVRRRSPSRTSHGPCHAHLPSRGWRMEDRSPPRRQPGS